MRFVVLSAVIAFFIGTSGVANAAQTALPPKGAQVGLVSNADQRIEIPRAAALGAHVLRVEYEIKTPISILIGDADLAARYKIRLQPLVGWENGATPPDLTPVAQWAKQLGPGGTHWSGKTTPYAITDIELGNENSFTYKSGQPTSAQYKSIATAYGNRALQAARAVRAANPKVGVLVELDDGNTGSGEWINDVLTSGGPQLVQLMHGPTIHPYGPEYTKRIARNFAFMSAKGATKPYYVTEWGIASDNGRAFGDNYNFPANLTYSQAGQVVTTNITKMRADKHVHQILLYEVSDLKPSSATSDKEAYFGAVTNTGKPKGALTAAIKKVMTA